MGAEGQGHTYNTVRPRACHKVLQYTVRMPEAQGSLALWLSVKIVNDHCKIPKCFAKDNCQVL
jgi:hypothetical protein